MGYTSVWYCIKEEKNPRTVTGDAAAGERASGGSEEAPVGRGRGRPFPHPLRRTSPNGLGVAVGFGVGEPRPGRAADMHPGRQVRTARTARFPIEEKLLTLSIAWGVPEPER